MISQPGLRRYVLLPLIISVLLFSGLGWLGYSQFDALLQWLLPEKDSWLGWLYSILRWLLWPLFALMLVLVVFYGFTLLANIIGAPFNDRLARKVEQRLSGIVPAAGTEPAFLATIWPTLRNELRKLGYFLSRAIPLLIISFIPVINAVAPLLWLVFSAWLLTLEYTAYPMENNGLEFSEQKRRVRGSGLGGLMFGAGTLLLMAIPVLNLAAMPAAVAGATQYWHERLSKR